MIVCVLKTDFTQVIIIQLLESPILPALHISIDIVQGASKKNRVLAEMDMVDMMFLFCWFIIFFWSFLSKTKRV